MSDTHDHYVAPPPTTPEGEIVLYRMPGDRWQVAVDPPDVAYLAGKAGRTPHPDEVEVLLVRESR